MNKPYVCIRTEKAGVHFGYLETKELAANGYAVTLTKSRRLWSWAGANSLSDLALQGSKKPKECKFTRPVNEIDLVAIEIIYIDEVGKKALDEIPEWTFES